MADLKPVYVNPSSPGRFYEPKAGDNLINEPELTVDNISELRGLDLTDYVRTKKVRTLSHTSLMDGGGGPPWYFIETSQATINNAGGYATGNGISITVAPIPERLLKGQVLEFSGGATFTLTEDVLKGATTITGDLAGSSVSDGEKSWLEDNNGTVLKPNFSGFSGVGRWKRVYRGPALVEWYGAADDGSTDNATAFQNALDNSKRVSTEHTGQFLFSSQVNITHDDALLDLGECECKVADNADIDLFHVTGDRSGVIGGTIDGNVANQPSTTNRSMVLIDNASDCFVKNIYIKNPDGQGIKARNSPRTLIKDNIVIDSNYYAIYTISNVADIEGASIIGNYVDRRSLGPLANGDGGGIVIHSDTGTPKTDTFRQSGGKVIGNTVYLDEGSTFNECFIVGGNRYSFSNNYSFGGSIGITLYGEYNACDNNIFEEANNWALEFTRSYKTTITGNLVRGNGNTQNGISQNADETGRSTHITICGNVVENCTQANYWIRFCDHTTVTGNVCIDGRMLFQGCKGLSVCANTWDDNGQSGNTAVSAKDQENFSFIGNNIDTPNITFAISFDSDDAGFVPDMVIIQGNFINLSGSNPYNTINLASGSIGDNWVVRDNRGPSSFGLENHDHVYFQNDNSVNVVFDHIEGDPSSLGLGNRGIGSLAIDRTNGKLYQKNGGTSVDWELVGTQT